MLKPALIPTHLTTTAEQTPVRILPIKPVRRFASFGILLRLIGFAFSMLRARSATPVEKARRARAFLENLGGLWVKAGQLISLRVDLMSPEMARELGQLQYQACGFSPAVARQIVEEAIGRPIEQVFDVFEDHPFAAASISQEHRAHLRQENAWVVIKVQRPGIARLFARDLKLITWVLKLGGLSSRMSFMNLDGMVRELKQIMREELDYRYEIGNLVRMRKLLRRHKVYVPKLFRAYSNTRIITMEEVRGLLMSDYLEMSRAHPEQVRAWCAENNVDPYKVGSRLLCSFYRQLFEDNLFHGDLHPGNIILLRNSRFALIDLGTIGNLEPKFLLTYRAMAQAVSVKDYSKSIDYYLLMCDSLPVFNVAEMRSEMVDLYRNWEARSHMLGLTYIERAVTGSIATDIQNIAAKYRVNPSWQFVRVGRAMMTMDASLNALLGHANPIKILKRYLRQARRRAIQEARRNLLNTVTDTASSLAETIKFTSDSVRRGAVQFQGIQTTANYLLRLVFRAATWILAIAFAAMVYDFLHQHHYQLVAALHENVGPLRTLARLIPPYEYGDGIAILLILVVLTIMFARIARRFSVQTHRLPNGRLDT